MKIELNSTCTSAELNRPPSPANPVKLGLGILLLTCLTGCVGYVGDGPGVEVGGPVVVAGPAVGFWGYDHDRGRDVRGYSARGAASRGVVHGGGGGHRH